MTKIRRFGCALILGMLLCPIAVNAQERYYSLLIDADDDDSTGCSVPIASTTVDGVEQRVTVVVSDPPDPNVIDLTVEQCVFGSFVGPTSIPDSGVPFPIGFDLGEAGADVVEGFAPLDSPANFARIYFTAADADSEDLLATTDGAPSGGPLVLRTYIPVPSVTFWGTFFLAFLLAVSAFVVLRDRRARSTVALTLLCFAILAFTPDGLIDEWTLPIATDATGDSDDETDIVAGFAAVVSNGVCFRIDVTDIPTSYQEVVLEDAPIIYWRLNETSGTTATNLGSLGSAVDGTIAGSPTLGATGALAGTTDTAFDFPGGSTSHYVILNPAPMPTSALSVEYWGDVVESGDTASVSYATSSADNNEFLIYNQSNLSIFINNQSTASGYNAADDTYHHVVVTWDSATGALIVYVDGAARYTTTWQIGSPITTNGALVLAQEQDTVGGSFAAAQALNGSLDEFAVYDRVLTPEEVAEHYEAGL